MQHFHRLSNPCLIAVLILAALTAACSQATPTAAPQPTTAAPEATATTAPTNTAVPPTATLAPTNTPVPPTATPQPTAAPTLGVADDGLSAWCLPPGMLSTMYQDPAAPPQGAVFGVAAQDAFDMSNLPYTACTFIYKFNQAVEPGMKLQVFELNQKTPWLTADLVPAASAPDTAAAQLKHTYIVEPPLWDVSYEFAVVDADGNELRRDRVNLHRWKPELCWNGQLPNMKTLRCPLQQDLHPWDPSYRTPFPTVPPGG